MLHIASTQLVLFLSFKINALLKIRIYVSLKDYMGIK